MRNRREISGSFLRRSNSARARSVWLQPSIYQKSETLNQILPPDRWSFGFWKWERPIWMVIKQTPKVMRNHSMVPPPIFASVNSFETNWMIQVAKDRCFFFHRYLELKPWRSHILSWPNSRLVLPTRPAKQTLRGRKKTSPKFNMCTNDIGRSLMNFRIQVY